MAVVLYSIEFFVYEKLEVQKCTRTDISKRCIPAASEDPQRTKSTSPLYFCSRLVSVASIFKKASGERLFRTDKDVGGSIQKRVCLQTRSPRMYRTYILGRGRPGFYTEAGLREYLKGSLMRLSCASESVLRPKADNRFKAFDTEPLCEHIGLFFAALPLLIGIVVIGF